MKRWILWAIATRLNYNKSRIYKTKLKSSKKIMSNWKSNTSIFSLWMHPSHKSWASLKASLKVFNCSQVRLSKMSESKWKPSWALMRLEFANTTRTKSRARKEISQPWGILLLRSKKTSEISSSSTMLLRKDWRSWWNLTTSWENSKRR